MVGDIVEIILYAIIAVAIFIRLHGILGRIDDSYFEDDDINNVNENFVKSSYSESDDELIDEKDLLQIISAVNKGYILEKIKQIHDIDKTFNPLKFIKSAEIAYEMIINSFTTGDKDKLKILVNGDLLNKLFEMMKKREERQEMQETTIVSVELCNIEDVKFDSKNSVMIYIKIISNQIIVVKDLSGKIKYGDLKKAQKVEDHFIFNRNFTNPDPTWFLVGMHEDF